MKSSVACLQYFFSLNNLYKTTKDNENKLNLILFSLYELETKTFKYNVFYLLLFKSIL